MKKVVALIAVAGVVALVLTAVSIAGTRGMTKSVTAKLTAAQEVPAQTVKDTMATGKFTGTLSGKKLSWKLTFRGLTGSATAAHIHIGAMGKAGNVLISLCAPCTSGVKGTATLTKSALKQLAKHQLYVNVHTEKNPNGETRGQLSEK